MQNFLNVRQSVSGALIRAGRLILPEHAMGHGNLVHGMRFRNPFKGELFRNGTKIDEANGWNDVTVVGKNHLLDVTFGAAAPLTQVDPWYIGLINNTPTPSLSENDTMDSHAGWTELTDYSGNRKEWVDADAASKVKGTTTVSTFTINATVTIYGIFVCADASSSASSVVLWATGGFDSTLDAISSDELKVTYGIRT